MAQAQPNFDKLGTYIQNIVGNCDNAVDEIRLLPNIPVVNLSNQMNQITAQLVQMQQDNRAFQREMRAFQQETREGLRAVNARLDTFQQETREGLRAVNARLDTFQQETREGLRVVNASLDTFQQETREGLRAVNNRLNIHEHNFQARLSNSGIAHNDTALSPLVNGRNQPVPGFPRNLMAINALTANTIAPLLAAYNLENAGTVDDKKRRFTRYIGARFPI